MLAGSVVMNIKTSLFPNAKIHHLFFHLRRYLSLTVCNIFNVKLVVSRRGITEKHIKTTYEELSSSLETSLYARQKHFSPEKHIKRN